MCARTGVYTILKLMSERHIFVLGCVRYWVFHEIEANGAAQEIFHGGHDLHERRCI